MTDAISDDRLHNGKSAAGHLTKKGMPTTEGMLAKRRHQGGGPTFVSFGTGPRPKPFYREAALDEWLRKNLSAPRRSTSDVIVREAA